ncbi:MAG TPA: L,D-transpeptidase family protein [Syntrophales bacterium]|nr:L,D-transpeptidase family protein [Syntrophales bacterium]HOX93913.1 L,D-transpeptidase family protein [Syntrophales bacterium]HPI57978.1 L,D-transpeptidase family protein [Syntrophales bacterium]HPN25894.1 L,D-transpeptidase family protein [Syntrophales bacterium]HQM29550.1 L,D-transpeptidase family protein [Syntrophales bacterium]
MNLTKKILLYGLAILTLSAAAGSAAARSYQYRLPATTGKGTEAKTVIGALKKHTIKPRETLLDVARNHGLGFHEIEILYPAVDPWIPKAGTRLTIPTLWVLPTTKRQGIVVNIPELRLYRFNPKTRQVTTYPVGIGDLETETPLGTYRVARKDVDPEWKVPPDRRGKYGYEIMPPGPDNPLGKYWIGLSNRKYGIHGTNNAWSIGRSVSGGCIRLYPEHISRLYKEVPVGTYVEIIYEPVKVGYWKGQIYMEVHPDLYEKIDDMEEHAMNLLDKRGLRNHVSIEKVKQAVENKNGLPVAVGRLPEKK